MDACLIAAGQRVEHYEIAAYGTLAAWAKAMGHTEAAELLAETLEEESAADEKLTSLAEGGINQEAAEGAHPEEEEEDEEESEKKPQPVGRGASRGGARDGNPYDDPRTALADFAEINARRRRRLLLDVDVEDERKMIGSRRVAGWWTISQAITRSV